jgi:uncharacterized protein (TIGR00369 family)
MGSRTQERFDRATSVPLLRFLGVDPVDPADPAAGLEFTVTDAAVNAVDALHGGAISTVLDVAAYLALLPRLEEGEEAITHALFVSYLRRAAVGDALRASGSVVRRGRQLAFVAAELRADERLLAAAQFTKSIVT